MDTQLPFTRQQIDEIAQRYPTPFHIYDEARILSSSQELYQAFQQAGFPDFTNYFAVKALPNPHIMRLLVGQGHGMDCSSLAELELAAKIGLKGQQIMFSSNDTPMVDYKRAMELGAVINFDDVSHIQPFLDELGVPEIACCRYNPGDIEQESGSESIIGKLSEAKFGMTKEQMVDAYKLLKEAGAKEFWLHTMPISNNLDWQIQERYIEKLFELAVEANKTLGINFACINLGGGIGIPYKPDQKAFDTMSFATSVQAAYKRLALDTIGKPRIVMESGRFITAPAGYLVTKAIHIKNTYKKYIGVDASMSNLMRPGMYGAYHHISVLGKDQERLTETVDVTGSLCENNDKFAINRPLPTVEMGDYLVIHTTGAHGHAMGFQYNGKLRSAELLLETDGKVTCIRRAETLDDYFATLSGADVATL